MEAISHIIHTTMSMSGSSDASSSTGFSFANASRNAFLAAQPNKSHGLPKATSTGTTIVSCIFAGDPNVPGDRGGVVLGADTRATEGPIVADKNCEKLHYIAPNIYCAGAGTAADTENVTRLISANLELHRLQTTRK